jgi:hypothetical protein
MWRPFTTLNVVRTMQLRGLSNVFEKNENEENWAKLFFKPIFSKQWGRQLLLQKSHTFVKNYPKLMIQVPN